MPHSHLSDDECRAALESSVAGFTVMDAICDPSGQVEDFTWRYVNEAAASLIGRPAEELAGRRITEAWDQPGLVQRYADVLATGITAEFDQHAGADDSKRWLRIVASHVNGSVAAWLTDISELRNTEEQLRCSEMRASKAARTIQAELARASRVMTLGELTTSIAHEVNQPLAALVSNADAALRWLGRLPDGGLEKARVALQHIVEDGHRAGKVIAHIRSLARTDVSDRAPVNLNEAILEVTRLLQLELSEAGVTLCTAFDENLPPVLGDRIQLQHMLLNLLRNALEATSGQPVREVIVGTWTEVGKIRIRIEDTGVGFDPQALNRIFEPFYTTKADGMGIGLSVCRTVVEAHRGRIWAELNQSRPGATFHCELPLEVASAAATTRRSP